jgi:hypothetical protein
MENLIMFYLAIIMVVILAMMALLFWGNDEDSLQALSKKINLLSLGSLLIGIMVIHMCWMILPFFTQKHGDVKGYAIILSIALINILPLAYAILKNTLVYKDLPEALKTDPSTV